MSNPRHFYIAGPMTGVPRFNIPEFEFTAQWLRAHGYVVTSPVELDSDAIYEAAKDSPDGKLPEANGTQIGGETWGQILARDVQVIADSVEGIVVLPKWFNSRGARLEVFVALLCKKPIYAAVNLHPQVDFDTPPQLEQLTLKQVVSAIAFSFFKE